ncbi:M48 family metalloprotease [Streptomyces sp. NPDC007070]|uniref:M48 family metalloprotease n=1 Tax=Streptomyces sp. NPDC007070 TaxID=3154312 RepID=UPI0033EC7163
MSSQHARTIFDHASDHGLPPATTADCRPCHVRLVHADGYHDEEVTEWGPVHQFFAGFRKERMVGALVEAVWNLHPSARPALVAWIRRLAEDGRPLVRTRAAHLLGVEPVLRVLRAWCTGDVESRRWTAVRAYGLLGPVHHEETLDTLLEAVRRPSPGHGEPAEAEDDEPTEEARQFADALELLLLAVREPVLRALAERLDGDRADRTVRAYALAAFCRACEQREDPEDRPLVLHWYAQAVVDGEAETARQLAGLWQALSADASAANGPCASCAAGCSRPTPIRRPSPPWLRCCPPSPRHRPTTGVWTTSCAPCVTPTEPCPRWPSGCAPTPTGATVLLVCLAGVTVVVLVAAAYGLVLLPLATPYAAVAVARRSELRADEHAAGLGFAPQLIAVLAEEHDREEAARVDPEAPFERHNIVARLLASHPDVPTRLHRLRARAEGRR